MSQLLTSYAWTLFGHVYLSACLSAHALKVWVITLSVHAHGCKAVTSGAVYSPIVIIIRITVTVGFCTPVLAHSSDN